MTDEELVEQLRDLGDHTSFEPHMHHVAATRIVELLAERDWYRDRVVWGFYEDREPEYYQGKEGESEICDPVTAEEVTGSRPCDCRRSHSSATWVDRYGGYTCEGYCSVSRKYDEERPVYARGFRRADCRVEGRR